MNIMTDNEKLLAYAKDHATMPCPEPDATAAPHNGRTGPNALFLCQTCHGTGTTPNPPMAALYEALTVEQRYWKCKEGGSEILDGNAAFLWFFNNGNVCPECYLSKGLVETYGPGRVAKSPAEFHVALEGWLQWNHYRFSYDDTYDPWHIHSDEHPGYGTTLVAAVLMALSQTRDVSEEVPDA